MKLNYWNGWSYLKLFQESLQYELIAIKKNAVTYSYLIQAFLVYKMILYGHHSKVI
jgi:hypothetical protein